MKSSKQLIAALFLIFTVIPFSAYGAAQNAEALKAANTYLKALENLQFKAAYDVISDEDKSVKTPEQFQNENSAVFIKAMRIDNKNFNKFTVKSSKDEDGAFLVTYSTTDLVFKEPGTSWQMALQPLKGYMIQNKADPDKPEQVNSSFKKMMAGAGYKQIPFASVERVVKLVKANNKWRVSTGWKRAAEKQIENNALSLIDSARKFPGDYSEAIGKLQEMNLKVTDSKVIKDGLALLEKYRDGMQKIIINASEPVYESPIKFIRKVEITNKSDLNPKFFIIEYSLLDSAGNVLLKTEVQTDGAFLDPPAPNGCNPGYSGIIANAYSTDDARLIQNWVKTRVILKAVTYAFE